MIPHESEYFRKELDMSPQGFLQLIMIEAREWILSTQKLKGQWVTKLLDCPEFKVWWLGIWTQTDKKLYHNLTIDGETVVRESGKLVDMPLLQYYPLRHRQEVLYIKIPDFILRNAKKSKIQEILSEIQEEDGGVWKPFAGTQRTDTTAIAPTRNNIF